MNKATAEITSLQASMVNSLISLEIEKLNKKHKKATHEWDKAMIERRVCYLQEVYTALKPLADELLKEIRESMERASA